MQKKCYWQPASRGRRGGVNQIWRVMRLTVLFLTVAFMHVHAHSAAQHVTISGKSLTLKEIFTAIKAQTGYSVLYSLPAVESSQPVSVDAKHVPLEQFLKEVFSAQPALEYSIQEKTVFVSRKKVAVYDYVSMPPVKILVTDVNGNALSGASVSNKNTGQSGITDYAGTLSLDVKKGDVIEVTFIGFEKQRVTIGDNGTVTIVLKQADSVLEGITVSTGYWKTDKRKSVGNISKITSKDIERQQLSSPLLALQGRVPGVEITPFSGVPGSAVTLRIRGLNSLDQKNLPLYVIDGVPVDATPLHTESISLGRDAQQIYSGFDPLSGINPQSIESIEILKDADATSIYGSRGANGVVLITTKKNISGDKLKVNFAASHSLAKVGNKMELLSKEQYMEMRREGIANDGPAAEDYFNDPIYGPVSFPDLLYWDTTRNTDWQEELAGGTTSMQNYQVNVMGGTGRTTFGVGGSYFAQQLPYPGDFGFKRYSVDFNLHHTSLDNRLTGTFMVKYGSTDNKLFESQGFLNNALTLSPVSPAGYNEDGSLNWALSPYNYSTWLNPYAELKNVNKRGIQNMLMNINFSYRLIGGLSFKVNAGLANIASDERITFPLAGMQPAMHNEGARASFTNSNNRTWTVEPQLVYEKEAGEHSFNALLGSTFQEGRTGMQVLKGTGYTSDAFINTITGAGVVTTSESKGHYRYASVFARFGYSYADKYLLNLTARRDGSSRFGPGKRYGNFGSIGAGWIFTEENFLKESMPWMNFGKIRISYGSTGSDGIGDAEYLKKYKLATGNYQGETSIIPYGLSEPDYRWEETRKLEIGLNTSFSNDRISAEVAWYRNRSSNQLVLYSLPGTTGFSNVRTNFNATVENTGWEFMINTVNISNAHFRWSSNVNLTLPRNRLVSFPGIETSTYASIYVVGKPLTVTRGMISKGVDPQTGLFQFEDVNGDGVADYGGDVTFLTALGQRALWGISNSLSYKNFELSFFIQGVDKIDRPGGGTSFGVPGTRVNQPAEVWDRWKKPGDIASYQRFSSGWDPVASETYNWWAYSDANLDKITFLRLKTADISYNVPSPVLKKMHMQNLRIYLQGQNLLTISDYRGPDPETLMGVPPLRSYTLGLNVTF